MSSKVFHILNGDALKEKFPEELEGDTIVLRECLVEGDVSGNDPAEIFNHRASFFERTYQIPTAGYRKTSQSEIEKTLHIPKESEVNLWFEDDLFCQVNLWFTAYLLHQNNCHYRVFLIRPNTSLQFGFSTLNSKDLIKTFSGKTEITRDDVVMFKELWVYFQNNDIPKLKEHANAHHEKFPFLTPAVDAESRRFPKGMLGEPHKILLELIEKHGKNNFGVVFKRFIEKVPIYGFGDMQVKRIFDELIKNENTQSNHS